MYPRINRQVSSITLQSILAAQIEVAGAHPTKQGERFHKPKEKLYICTMNIRTLSIGAVMPSEILSNFEMVRVEEESSLIRIYLIDYARPTIFASEKR